MSPSLNSSVKRITLHLLTFFLYLVSFFLWFVSFGAGGGNRVYAVEFASGTSMEPVVHDGDLLIISHLVKKNLQPGMIIAFETSNGDDILHRIVTVKENGCLITKGDNNPVEDEGEVCQIDGILVTNIPKLGRFFYLLQSLMPWNKNKGP